MDGRESSNLNMIFQLLNPLFMISFMKRWCKWRHRTGFPKTQRHVNCEKEGESSTIQYTSWISFTLMSKIDSTNLEKLQYCINEYFTSWKMTLICQHLDNEPQCVQASFCSTSFCPSMQCLIQHSFCQSFWKHELFILSTFHRSSPLIWQDNTFVSQVRVRVRGTLWRRPSTH